MSLITQCPACSTMFRVVPDQLRISEGWVRCGQCDEVFDANAHLKNLEEVLHSEPEAAEQLPPSTDQSTSTPPEPDPLADSAPVPEPTPVPQPDPEADALPAEEEEPQTYDWGLDLPQTDPPSPGIDIALPTEPANGQQELDAAAEQLYERTDAVEPPQGVDSNAPIEPFLDVALRDLPEPEVAAPAQRVSESIDHWMHEKQVDGLGLAATSAATAVHPEDVPLSFMPKNSKPSGVGRWFNARVLAAVSAVMALALTGQFAWHQRDRLAANYPVLREPLASACELAGCKIAAPRQIDSIAIESSAFTNVRPGVYLLQVTLKNSASLDLAVPALELTLTDLQDRPLFRKVIQADEIKAKVLTFGAGSELNASVPIHVRDGAASSVTGYKLLAFYP